MSVKATLESVHRNRLSCSFKFVLNLMIQSFSSNFICIRGCIGKCQLVVATWPLRPFLQVLQRSDRKLWSMCFNVWHICRPMTLISKAWRTPPLQKNSTPMANRQVLRSELLVLLIVLIFRYLNFGLILKLPVVAIYSSIVIYVPYDLYNEHRKATFGCLIVILFTVHVQ